MVNIQHSPILHAMLTTQQSPRTVFFIHTCGGALTIITFCIVCKYEFLKFHDYLIEGFRIDLKTFFGLAMPNQYCPTVRM